MHFVSLNWGQSVSTHILRWVAVTQSTWKDTKPVNDRDLDFLFQDTVRDSSLDQELKSDFQKKKTDPKYLEMRRAVVHMDKSREHITKLLSSVQSKRTERELSPLTSQTSRTYKESQSSRLPRKQGSILYCTTGIILQWLRSDPHLSTISHIVLDEIHERNLQSDVLITIMKDLLKFRDDLKIILMSATLNAEKFSKYFRGCCPQNQDGRPKWKKCFMQGQIARPEKELKKEEYRESWPSYARSLRDSIDQAHCPEIRDNFVIIPLHSLMPTVNQTQVFKKPPPGVRKIVIATNIAETRVQPGQCYHLYNGLRASLLGNYQLPEIMRTPLEELCLQIKVLDALDPLSDETVNLAITHLMDLNALDKNEDLTPLGFHLARFPVEPHIGKMILFGGWEEAKRHGYKAERYYCWEHLLSSNTLQMLHNMKAQFAEHLLAAGFVGSKNPKDPNSIINSGPAQFCILSWQEMCTAYKKAAIKINISGLNLPPGGAAVLKSPLVVYD
ncbi:UNVERIFIED_CONTAM: hypothetical protein FKN15_027054 [Acipenser sinensis]